MIPYLGEQFLKISSKLVHNIILQSSQSPIDKCEIVMKLFWLQNLQIYWKIKDSMFHYIFETDMEKEIYPKNKFKNEK